MGQGLVTDRSLKNSLFILGTGRSGTTIVFRMLASHPELGWFSNYEERFPRVPQFALASRLLDHVRRKADAKRAAQRKGMIGSGDRSQRIRTYNFPQNRVTDHRVNLTLYSLDRAMEGEIEELIDALRERDLSLRLEQELKDLGGAAD